MPFHKIKILCIFVNIWKSFRRSKLKICIFYWEKTHKIKFHCSKMKSTKLCSFHSTFLCILISFKLKLEPLERKHECNLAMLLITDAGVIPTCPISYTCFSRKPDSEPSLKLNCTKQFRTCYYILKIWAKCNYNVHFNT